MQFLSIVSAAVLATISVTAQPTTTAKSTTAISDITGWTHILNPSSPFINTTVDLYGLSDAYNGTIRLDRVNGISMIIDHVSNAQVGFVGGELAITADPALANQKVRPNASKTHVKQTNTLLEEMEKGTSKYEPYGPDFGKHNSKHVSVDTTVSSSSLEGVSTVEDIAGPGLRITCGGCLIQFSCKIRAGDCSSICVGFICYEV